MRVIAVIPAYNEETTIGEVLRETSNFVDGIVVVNDGSSDRTAEIAHSHGVCVVSHVVNRGLGAAIGTGFAAALLHHPDVIVTLDGDGQHLPNEISRLVQAIENGADMVIGSRLRETTGMPIHRRLANHTGNALTFLLFGIWVSDSQSGFRAFTPEAVSRISIKTNRMEVSSELIAEAKRHGFSLAEVPITPVYTDYSLSKGQSFWVGIKTLIKLVIRRFVG